MNLPSVSLRWRHEIAPHGRCAKCGHAFTPAEKQRAHPYTTPGANKIDFYCGEPRRCCWCFEEDQ